MVKGRMGADGEDKKLTRLIKNREAAQQARDKKKQYVSDLETENETLKKKVSELETKCSSLEKHCTTINEVSRLLLTRRNGGKEKYTISVHSSSWTSSLLLYCDRQGILNREEFTFRNAGAEQGKG